MTDWQDDGALAGLELAIDGWLASFRAENPVVAAVDRGEPSDSERRWYVRMRGDEKDFITVWLTLGQRTLRYEAYVMPAPEENIAEVYEQLLRRNERLVGAHFAIGVEDAIFLRGELPNAALTEAELDRIIGSLYAYVEQSFPALIRLGYPSRFRDAAPTAEPAPATAPPPRVLPG
ncbi:MAG: YbjN domain-containing protein [Acidimicrobiia bacterium]